MEKPILFNTEMVRAILDGRKTVTRRVIKPQPECVRRCADRKMYGAYETVDADRTPYMFNAYRKPPYSKGDVLYVREAFGYSAYAAWDGITYYKADASEQTEKTVKAGSGWHPSIHMPRAAARIFLRVTDVRVERLQAITEDGVCEEGAEKLISCPNERTIYYQEGGAEPCFNTNVCSKCNYIDKSYPELFGKLVWNKTIKPRDLPLYGWYANPWVWVIEFERLEDYKPNESNP